MKASFCVQWAQGEYRGSKKMAWGNIISETRYFKNMAHGCCLLWQKGCQKWLTPGYNHWQRQANPPSLSPGCQHMKVDWSLSEVTLFIICVSGSKSLPSPCTIVRQCQSLCKARHQTAAHTLAQRVWCLLQDQEEELSQSRRQLFQLFFTFLFAKKLGRLALVKNLVCKSSPA